MKTKTTYSILFISLLVPIVRVDALELRASTSMNVKSQRLEMRKENRMEARDDMREKAEELRTSIKEARTKKLDDKAKGRVEIRLDNLYKMLTNRLDRLTRVDAEITKRLAGKTDVVAVLALQASAQTALAKARVDIEATKSASLTELTSTTSKVVLRNLVNTAEASIKTAAEAYKKVTQAMPKTRGTASSIINN